MVDEKLIKDTKINSKKKKLIDLRPFKDEEVNYEVNKFLNDKKNYAALSGLIKLTTKGINAKEVIEEFRESNSIDDFQKTYSKIIKGIHNKSITNFATRGLENVDKNKKYRMVYHHVNIEMDSLEPNYALISNGHKGTFTLAGDNLLEYELVHFQFRALGTIILPRYENAGRGMIQVSDYLHKTKNERSSLTSETPGRSRHNYIQANPSAIKMLIRGNLKEGKSINDCVNGIIMPVTIIREFEPSDVDLVKEQLEREQTGNYTKSKYEDVWSMYKGITGQKGNVIIHFGKPLNGNFEIRDENGKEDLKRELEEVTKAIDTEMLKNFEPMATHKYAHDYLTGKDMKGRVNPLKNRIKGLTNVEINRLYQFYANPYFQKIELN